MKFKVISSNPSNEGKTFVTKINHTTTVETVFGTKSKNEAFYVSGTKQVPVGTEIDVDLNQFQVKEYPYTNESTGETMQLKWLHLK